MFQNRLRESVQLFDSICNSRWFKATPIMVFLNKRDIFAEKILLFPLKTDFPEYTGT